MESLSFKQPKSFRAQEMVDRIIKSREITNEKVLNAMAKIPRHLFVPEALQAHAYSDRALPIGHDQTISQPYIVALMSEIAVRSGAKKVLEIGTGSGYQTAILAELFDSVFSIEKISSLVPTARQKIENLGYHNVSIQVGNGNLGWTEYAPFDAIIVTAAAANVPEILMEQVKEKGVMVLPLGPQKGPQELYALQKFQGRILRKFLCHCQFVPFVP